MYCKYTRKTQRVQILQHHATLDVTLGNQTACLMGEMFLAVLRPSFQLLRKAWNIQCTYGELRSVSLGQATHDDNNIRETYMSETHKGLQPDDSGRSKPIGPFVDPYLNNVACSGK